MEPIPYVSVIVPMYNAEKYIGELLESLLAQTLKNFEVIIVDDCSTDKSCAIVESYLHKFEGRLNLIKLQTNSGGPSIPRNKGLEMSRGKYIFFMDNDDAVTKTALEEMFALAELSKADVIYRSQSFQSKGVGNEFFENVQVIGRKLVDKPTFLTEDLAARVQARFQGMFRSPPWLYFLRRDFLIEKSLKFFPVYREDDFWSLSVVFSAKKFLLAPNICNIRRTHENSLTNSDKPLNKYLKYWLDRSINGLKILDDFLSGIDFFRTHPDYRFAVLSQWLNSDLGFAFQKSKSDSPQKILETFSKEFKEDLGDYDLLISYLFTNSIMLMRNLALANQKIQELSAPPRVGFRITLDLYSKNLTPAQGAFLFCYGLISKLNL